MQKVKIRLPAVITEFGASLGELGLAISLYVQIEVSPRPDEKLLVETIGVDAGYYPLGLQHPVILGMMRVFQELENAPTGLNVRIDNHIPIESGLNAHAVLMQAGIVAANSLMGHPFQRDEILNLGAKMSANPTATTTTMLGGLQSVLYQDEILLHHALTIAQYRFILVIPHLEDYNRPAPTETFDHDQVWALMGYQPLMIQALASQDVTFLARVAHHPIDDKRLAHAITGYAHVGEVARLAGALGMMTSGRGPAMIVLCNRNHQRIAEVIEAAYHNLGINALVTLISVDTQGIVISMMSSG